MVPIARGICEYSFGIYSNGPCEKHYTKCVYGEPVAEPCTPGLAYDERTHSCNWPDLLEYCNPEGNLSLYIYIYSGDQHYYNTDKSGPFAAE